MRNPYWDPATDPNRKALPDNYHVELGIDATDLDNQLIAGTIQVDLAGTGVQTATLPQVLNDPTNKAHADNPIGSAPLVHVDHPDGGTVRQHRLP